MLKKLKPAKDIGDEAVNTSEVLASRLSIGRRTITSAIQLTDSSVLLGIPNAKFECNEATTNAGCHDWKTVTRRAVS